MQRNNALSITDDNSRILEGSNLSCSHQGSSISDKEAQKTLLSIVVLTMNRKNEVLRTLQSCIECALPEKAEFVIVDNASDDGTKEAVDCFFEKNAFEYQYHYLSENIGAAAGRNEGFKGAKGRYVYFIEDDAYIDAPKQSFFKRMINYLEANSDVFCITTSIFDTALNSNRTVIASRDPDPHKYKKAFMFHGGSFLVDRQRGFDQEKLFLGHQIRGMPELYPSLKSYFNDRYIVEMNDLNVIHDPVESARFYSRKSIIRHYVHATQVKHIFYPLAAYPFLYIMFGLRITKHLGLKALVEAYGQLLHTNRDSQKETTSYSMLMKLVREFGFCAAF